MILLLNILLLIVGFVALIKGADLFVDGSASLARTFKVPSVIIGLTIVAAPRRRSTAPTRSPSATLSVQTFSTC